MNRFCPNCGDPIEAEELFCDKCGTKLNATEGGENTYQTGNQNNNQAYQTPPSYNYKQNQYNSEPQNSMNQSTPQYATNQQFQQAYVQPQKSAGKKVFKIVGTAIGVVAILIVVLGIILNLNDNKPNTKTTGNTNNTKPAVESTKPASTNNAPDSSKALDVWAADIKVNTNYAAAEKSIYVEYSVSLMNKGTSKATSVNVYLDPEQNDPNVSYLGVKPKTIVNFNAPVASINSGETKVIKEKFLYDNIEVSTATQEKLQDIANRYITLPVLIEWQENGKTHTQRLTQKNSSSTPNTNSTRNTTNNSNVNDKLSYFYGTFQLIVPGVSYTTENQAENTRTTHTSVGVQSGGIKINPDGTYVWNSTWDGKVINGNWKDTGKSDYPILIVKGEEGKDWALGKSTQSGSDITIWNGSIWKVGKKVK